MLHCTYYRAGRNTDNVFVVSLCLWKTEWIESLCFSWIIVKRLSWASLIGGHRKWEGNFPSFSNSYMKWELWDDVGIWNLSSRAWLHSSHMTALGFQPGDLGIFEPPSVDLLLNPPTLNIPGNNSNRYHKPEKWSQSCVALCTVWPLPCEKCPLQVSLQYLYPPVLLVYAWNFNPPHLSLNICFYRRQTTLLTYSSMIIECSHGHHELDLGYFVRNRQQTDDEMLRKKHLVLRKMSQTSHW